MIATGAPITRAQATAYAHAVNLHARDIRGMSLESSAEPEAPANPSLAHRTLAVRGRNTTFGQRLVADIRGRAPTRMGGVLRRQGRPKRSSREDRHRGPTERPRSHLLRTISRWLIQPGLGHVPSRRCGRRRPSLGGRAGAEERAWHLDRNRLLGLLQLHRWSERDRAGHSQRQPPRPLGSRAAAAGSAAQTRGRIQVRVGRQRAALKRPIR